MKKVHISGGASHLVIAVATGCFRFAGRIVIIVEGCAGREGEGNKGTGFQRNKASRSENCYPQRDRGYQASIIPILGSPCLEIQDTNVDQSEWYI